MSMTFLNQLSIIPALLITLTGLLMLRGLEIGKAARRLLLYSLGMGVLILLGLFVTMRFITEPYDQPFFQLSNLLAPSILGLTALIILNVKALAQADTRIRIAAILAGLAVVFLFGLLWSSQLGVGYLILPGALILAIGWALGKRYGWLVIILGLLSLGIFFLFNHLMIHPPDYSGNSPALAIRLLALSAFYVIPGLSVVISGILITTSLHSSGMQTENDMGNRPPRIPGRLGYYRHPKRREIPGGRNGGGLVRISLFCEIQLRWDRRHQLYGRCPQRRAFDRHPARRKNLPLKCRSCAQVGFRSSTPATQKKLRLSMLQTPCSCAGTARCTRTNSGVIILSAMFASAPSARYGWISATRSWIDEQNWNSRCAPVCESGRKPNSSTTSNR